MKTLPSIRSELNKETVNFILKKNFNTISPFLYKLTTEWFNGSYRVFNDLNKYLILIYFVNKDFEFYRRNNINITYESFYRSKDLEIIKVNIIQIANDLNIPKESVRRKIISLEKEGIITKVGKKVSINRLAYKSAQPVVNLQNVSSLLSIFTKLLKKNKLKKNYLETEEVLKLLKQNFSFCWYQFYKFLFSLAYRWQSYFGDLELFLIMNTIVFNTNSNLVSKLDGLDSYLEKWRSEIQKTNIVGINAMSISDITGIPRPTVVRKLKFLIKNKFIIMDKKKLFHLKLNEKNYKDLVKRQDETLLSISDFITRTFNQINLN